MFSKFKILATGAALAVVSSQAFAETYTYGENAAGSSVVTDTVSSVTTQAGVTNTLTHTANLITSLIAPTPVTPSAPVAPAPAPVGGPAPAPSGGGNTPSATPAPGGDNTSMFDSNIKKSVTLFDTSSQKGYGAGNMDGKSSVWGNMSYSWMESDVANANFDGNVTAINIGYDRWVSKKLLAGVSLGYAVTDVDTTFNNGKFEEDGVTISPYAVYLLGNNLSLTGMVGHTWSSIDQNRQNGATTASTDAETLFASGILSYSKQINRLGLAGRVAYLWADRDTDGFTESDNNVVAATTAKTSQGKLGAEASYFFPGEKVNLTPYASVDFLNDWKDEINNDSTAFDLGIGVRIGSKDGATSGAIGLTSQVGRSDFESNTATATLRFNF